MFGILLNIFRKAMPNNLYAVLRGIFGHGKTYNQCETYFKIFSCYQNNNVHPKGKKILEVGCGAQLYTGLMFRDHGAESVFLADPALKTITEAKRREQFRRYKDYCKAPINDSLINNISTFHDLNEIPNTENKTFDFICSNTVLEHLRSLDGFFISVKRLLKKDGICFNVVDLSDHVYHMFDGRNLTKWICDSNRLHHLRYSEKFYALMTDTRIWVNRYLLPYYVQQAESNHLSLDIIASNSYPEVPIHKDILAKNAIVSLEKKYRVFDFKCVIQHKDL